MPSRTTPWSSAMITSIGRSTPGVPPSIVRTQYRLDRRVSPVAAPSAWWEAPEHRGENRASSRADLPRNRLAHSRLEPRRHQKDYTDRHLWDHTIGTFRLQTNGPARPHHVGYAAREPHTEPHTHTHQAALGHTGIRQTALGLARAGAAPAARSKPRRRPRRAPPHIVARVPPARRSPHPPALRVIAGPTRILLAGADAERRATLLDELSQTLPESTVFEQADAVCEALEHASGSRMAFIAGDLDDAPAESLMQTLAHRHPELPVLIVDGPAEAHGPHAVYNDELRLRHG